MTGKGTGRTRRWAPNIITCTPTIYKMRSDRGGGRVVHLKNSSYGDLRVRLHKTSKDKKIIFSFTKLLKIVQKSHFLLLQWRK